MLMAGPVGQFLQVMDKIRDLATNYRRSKTVNLRKVFDEADSGGSGRIGQRELFKMFINRGASGTHLR